MEITVMKKYLCLLPLLTLLAVGCDKPTPEEPKGDVTLTLTTEDSLWFDAEGGTGVIGFALEGATIGQLKATASVDWITNIAVSEVVSYTVESNTSEEDRRGVITLACGDKEEIVTVMQYGKVEASKTFTAKTLSGSKYYGNDKTEGSYNYYVVLSDNGMTDKGDMYADSTYYALDIYSDEGSKTEDEAIIPMGEYSYDGAGSMKAGSISAHFSNYTTTYNGVIVTETISDARMVVGEDKIEVYVTLESGEVHYVRYDGNLTIPAYSSTVVGGLSTLKSNYNFNIESGVFVGAYVGDLMGTGCNTCQVYMWEHLDLETGEERGDTFQIDLQLPRGGTDICGTYTEGTAVGHFIPGSAEDLGGQYMQQNSWYITADYIHFAPMISGTVKVESEDGINYTFTIDVMDDSGNAIRGTFKGYGEFTEW